MTKIVYDDGTMAGKPAPDCYLAAAGSVKDGIVERLRQELKEMKKELQKVD